MPKGPKQTPLLRQLVRGNVCLFKERPWDALLEPPELLGNGGWLDWSAWREMGDVLTKEDYGFERCDRSVFQSYLLNRSSKSF